MNRAQNGRLAKWTTALAATLVGAGQLLLAPPQVRADGGSAAVPAPQEDDALVGRTQTLEAGVDAGYRTGAPGELRLRVRFERVLTGVDLNGPSLQPLERTCLNSGRGWVLTTGIDGTLGALQAGSELGTRTSESYQLNAAPISLKSVNCYDSDPLEHPTVTLQLAPAHLSREQGAGIERDIRLSIFGIEGRLSRTSLQKASYNQNDPDPKIGFEIVGKVEFMGITWKQLEARWGEYKGYPLSADLKAMISYQVTQACQAQLSGQGFAGISAMGTTGDLHELSAGAGIAVDCLDLKEVTQSLDPDDRAKAVRAGRAAAKHRTFEVKAAKFWWADDAGQGGEKTQVIGGFKTEL